MFWPYWYSKCFRKKNWTANSDGFPDIPCQVLYGGTSLPMVPWTGQRVRPAEKNGIFQLPTDHQIFEVFLELAGFVSGDRVGYVVFKQTFFSMFKPLKITILHLKITPALKSGKSSEPSTHLHDFRVQAMKFPGRSTETWGKWSNVTTWMSQEVSKWLVNGL